MKIYFTTSADGEVFPLEVNPSMTVLQLKNAMKAKASIKKSFSPFCGDRNLAPDATKTAVTLLSDCDIEDGITLEIKFKCQNFGCQQYFDPAKWRETKCVHHERAPMM